MKRLALYGFGVAVGVAVLWFMTPLVTPTTEPAPIATAIGVEARANATPSIAADGQTVAIAWGATRGDGSADVFVAVSRDGGGSFGPPVRVNDVEGSARLSGEMAPRVVVTALDGRDAEVQVLWTAKGSATTIRLARSADGGRTFASSQALQAEGAAGDRGWPALTKGRDGRPRAVWLDHRGRAAVPDAVGDHENAKTTHHHGHDAAAAASGDGVDMAQRSAIYYSDGMVERAITNGVCYCCKTALAVGNDGRVFTAWRHVYPGNMRDIAFASSSDDGGVFTTPVRVSQDQWQIDGCPDDGPAMAVGRGGAVHLVWPTVVAQPTAHKGMFYATSQDGVSFAPRVRVSPAGRNIAHPQIALSDTGDVVVLWDEVVDGARRVFLSRLRGGAFSDAETLSTGKAASYPVAVFSGSSLVVAWTEGEPDSSQIAVRSWR